MAGDKMMRVAERAVEFVTREAERKAARAALNDAYARWKARAGLARVERNTLDWVRMTKATTAEYETLEAAKKAEYNAMRRLRSAVKAASE